MNFRDASQEVNAGPDLVVAEPIDHRVQERTAIAHHAFDKLDAARRQSNELLTPVLRVFGHRDQVQRRFGQGAQGFRDGRTCHLVPGRKRTRDVLAAHLPAIHTARVDRPEETGLLARQHAAFQGVFNLHAHEIVDRKKQVEEVAARLFALREVHAVSGSLLQLRQ